MGSVKFWLVLSSLLLSGGAACAECLMPDSPPAVPDGSNATDAEMRAGREALQAFVNKLQSYQSCLEAELKAAPADTLPQLKIAWRAAGNAAIDQAQQLAQDYDRELKLFKSLHPGAQPAK